MNKLGMFVGGALVGMAGLAAVACLTDKEDEKKISLVDRPDDDSIDALSAALSSYCRKAHRLAMRVNEFSLDCDKYITGSFTFDSDGLLTRLTNAIGDKMVVISRASCVSSIRDLKRECENYFAEHSYLFAKANEVFRSKNMPEININVPAPNMDFSVDNAIANENWSMDMGKLCDVLHDYVTKTAVLAGNLSEKLDSLTDDASPSNALPQAC